jgi:hypothetical protein
MLAALVLSCSSSSYTPLEDPHRPLTDQVGDTAPANFDELECALHQLAFTVGAPKLPSSSDALSDALLLGTPNCTKPALAVETPLHPRLSSFAASSAPTFQDLYVAPNGVDSAGAGTLAKPFATIGYAVVASRKLAPASRKIAVRGGHYYLSATIVLDHRDSGLTIAGYNREHVVLHGSQSLAALSWSPAASPFPKGVFVAPLAALTRSAAPQCGFENNTDMQGNDLPHGTHEEITSVGACCELCANTSGCNAFTYRCAGCEESLPQTCWLKTSAAGARPYSGHSHVSGTMGKPPSPGPPAPTPSPPPTHVWGRPPQLGNQLLVGGRRMVRARFPNGDPQELSGICFSAVDHPELGEGCTSYLPAMGSTKTLPNSPALATISGTLNRGQSPKLGCPECTDYGSFKYKIYAFPDGHPVYDTPDALKGHSDWNNASLFSFWGSPFNRPANAEVDPSTWTNKTWADPATGVVHMFHSGLWGGWQYKLTDFDATSHTIEFGYGGYQEARGSGVKSNHFYVENIKEELDVAGEWFHDEKEGQIYYFPNATHATAAALATAEIAILDTLISIGSAADEASGEWADSIQIIGLELTATRATYLSPYEIPSGGDWSIHRGGAIEVTQARNVAIRGCFFNQVGGNGLLFTNAVLDSSVVGNEFAFTGDSAVVFVGSTVGIDGTVAGGAKYPNRNNVSNNLMREFGIYGKQTSCFFQAVSANTTLNDNVCFNGPRAGVNFNDGFGGNYEMKGNLIFNTVRETGDHGPFNSWDRQPYLSTNGVDDGFTTEEKNGLEDTSFVGAPSRIVGNFIFNGYSACSAARSPLSPPSPCAHFAPPCLRALHQTLSGRSTTTTVHSFTMTLQMCLCGGGARTTEATRRAAITTSFSTRAFAKGDREAVSARQMITASSLNNTTTETIASCRTVGSTAGEEATACAAQTRRLTAAPRPCWRKRCIKPRTTLSAHSAKTRKVLRSRCGIRSSSAVRRTSKLGKRLVRSSGPRTSTAKRSRWQALLLLHRQSWGCRLLVRERNWPSYWGFQINTS